MAESLNRRLIFLTIVLGAVWLGAISRIVGAADVTSPNFIIIFTDDQGYADLGCYGSPYIRTPHIDRLATEGIRFTDFYAQPFCGPSRAALMTGCYPPRNSLMFNHLPRAKTGMHIDEVTLPELLKQRGYATAMFGKWHLGDATAFLPRQQGFDEYLGLPYSNDMWPFHPKVLRTADDTPLKTALRQRAEYTGYEGQGQVYPLNWFPDLPLIRNDSVIELNPDQSKLTQLYTEEAISFIERKREKPFFVYLAHAMPHVPLFRSSTFEKTSLRGLYGDVIEEIDASVGRIVEILKRLELDEKTLIVFTSDNGPWLHYGIDAGSAGPLRDGKGTVWEGGVRVPAIVRWPGSIPGGRVTSEIGASIDLLPTFVTLAGAEIPRDRPIDGVDLWPLLSGSTDRSPRQTHFYYEGKVFYNAEDGTPVNEPKLSAVRHQQWKLFLGLPEGNNEPLLYDLRADIGETRSVATWHPDVVARLKTLAAEFDADLMSNVRPLGQLD